MALVEFVCPAILPISFSLYFLISLTVLYRHICFCLFNIHVHERNNGIIAAQAAQSHLFNNSNENSGGKNHDKFNRYRSRYCSFNRYWRGIGIGLATSKAVEAIARQPEAESKISKNLLLGCALAEGTAILVS